jgi:hypothetical protein
VLGGQEVVFRGTRGAASSHHHHLSYPAPAPSLPPPNTTAPAAYNAGRIEGGAVWVGRTRIDGAAVDDGVASELYLPGLRDVTLG